MIMKKYVGFTLIELMIAVSILAILSAFGISRYVGAQQASKDAKKKADIDAIANAYETGFDFINKTYSALTTSDFAGSFPKQPDGSNYTFVEGPGASNPVITATNASTTTFLVCAKVGSGCYCRGSTNKNPTSANSCP